MELADGLIIIVMVTLLEQVIVAVGVPGIDHDYNKRSGWLHGMRAHVSASAHTLFGRSGLAGRCVSLHDRLTGPGNDTRVNDGEVPVKVRRLTQRAQVPPAA